MTDNTTLARLCKAQMRHGSKSFFAASRLLPRQVRHDATALYAFCRAADDAIDLANSDSARHTALIHLHERLDHIYAGKPLAYAPDMLLAPVVLQHQIPRELLNALLEGLAWDAAGKRYATITELYQYCARVAGTVGVMMSLVMGVRNPDALYLASELGAAMQLTNIARDVGEDARAGRMYLPLEWLDEAGMSADEFMSDPQATPAILNLVQRLLCEADQAYTSAQRGIVQLPADCQFAILSASKVYAAIGKCIRRNQFDSISQRAVVGLAEKLMLIAQARISRTLAVKKGQSIGHPSSTDKPVVVASRFLIHAVESFQASPHPNFVRSVLPAKRSFLGRTEWVLELAENLAQRDRQARAVAP